MSMPNDVAAVTSIARYRSRSEQLGERSGEDLRVAVGVGGEWRGVNSAMLWNGVSSTPRLRAYRCRNASSSASPAAAAAAPSRGGGQNQYSARQPRRCTCHGRSWAAITAGDAGR